MREALLNAIDQIRAKPDLDSYDEAITKQAVILRLLAAVGWDPFNPEEVRAEYTTFGKRVDYSLRLNGVNKVFIEVKQTCVSLDIHEEQLLGYAFQEGVKLAVLTNGVIWQFYLPLQEGTWTERRYYTADMRQQTAADFAEKLVEFLSRTNVDNGEAVRDAEQMLLSVQRRQKLEAAIPIAWNEIVSKPPDPFVELISDAVKKNCGLNAANAEIRVFLTNHLPQLKVTPQRIPEPLVSPLVEEPYKPSLAQYSRTGKTDFKDACFSRVGTRLKRLLAKRMNSRAYTADGKTAVYCTCSREYKGRDYVYWFTIYRSEITKLDSIADSYLVLGCGSEQHIVIIPLSELNPWLPRLRRGKTDEREGWDIYIVTDQGKWLLLTAPDASPIDITRYLL